MTPEERAKQVVENFMHKPTHHSNPDMIWREHIANAIREATAEEVEECCKDICSMCREGFPVGRGGGMTMTPRDARGCSVWAHRVYAEDSNGNKLHYDISCSAQSIRGRAENS